MDLTDGDIKLLTAMRRRSRVAKAVIALFALKGLLLAGVAVYFGIRACRPPLVLDQHSPFWSLELLVRQGELSAAGLFGVQTIVCLMVCLFTWSQRKSDALTLRLIDEVSGYPTSSL